MFDRSVGYSRPIGRDTDSRPPRERILDAAEALFAAHGFGGVGMAGVAEQAGLGKASLFHHFPTKAQLYCAVMARLLTTLDDAMVRSLAEGGTPTARLERSCDAAIDVLAQNPAYPRLLIRVLVEEGELPSGLPEGKEAADALQRFGTRMVRLLHEGMDVGELRRASVGHTLLSIVGAVVHPLATGRFGEQLVQGSLLDPDQVAKRKDAVRQLLYLGIVDGGSGRPTGSGGARS